MRRWNKEKTLFAIALVLFVWTAAKLGILLTRREAPPPTPAVVAPAIHHGDPRLGDFLRPRALDSELGRGSQPAFGGPDQPPPPPAEEKQKLVDDAKPKGGDRNPDKNEGGGGKPDEGNRANADEQGNGGGETRDGLRLGPPPPPLTLVAIVQTDGNHPRTQAVVRDGQSGRLLRLSVGDLVLDDLRLDTITDDSVTLVGAGGHRHVLRGRFETQYGH